MSESQIHSQAAFSETKKYLDLRNDAMSKTSRINPLPLGNTILFFIVPAAILYVTHYFLIPIYVVRNDVTYFTGYLLGYVITMGMFFFGALIAYRREGNPSTWDGLKSRFRLVKMNQTDWLWTVMLIILVLITYLGLAFTGEWVRSVPIFGPREAWPAEFGPGGTSNVTPGVFMGSPLKGQWGLVIVYFIGWFFNIFGEEFWFRGYILPRQELAFRKSTWFMNGLMFTLTHLWQPWILIAILPSSLLLPYAVQYRRNTWIGIIQHGFVNLTLLIFLIGGVIGVL